MRVFKPFNRPRSSKDESFIGAFMDKDVDVILTLFALGTRVTKSFLFRTIIGEWIEKNDEDPIEMVSKQVFDAWKHEGGVKFNFIVDFEKEVRKDLQEKGVPEKIQDKIMEGFYEHCVLDREQKRGTD